MFLRGELDNPTTSNSSNSKKEKGDAGGGGPWSKATTTSSMSCGLSNIGGASTGGSMNHLILAEQKEKQQQGGSGGLMKKKTLSFSSPTPTSSGGGGGGGGSVKKKMSLAEFIGRGGKSDDQPQPSAWGNTGVGNSAGAPLSTVTGTSATAIGASPPACITPLRRIQDEQVAETKMASPFPSTTTSTKWYVPSVTIIQAEENAVKQLEKRFR